MNKDAIRKARSAAVTFNLHLDDNDQIHQMIQRESGLFVVTGNSVVRLRSPDDLDPELNHANAPWEQSVYLPHGARDPFVARTILQTDKLAQLFLGKTTPQYISLMDIGWEVLSSLVSLRVVKERLEKRVSNIIEIIDADLETYTHGKSPKPLPVVEYCDIEFRFFVNEMRRVLSKISELFGVLTTAEIEKGHFHKALEWAKAEYGADSMLARMLSRDHRWIKTWIDVRIAIEHPEADRFVETLNFSLEKDRKVRLPTWRFVHPDYDLARPQNLLDTFDIAITNVLTFYESLQILLSDGHRPSTFKVAFNEIPEAERNPEAPMRFEFQMIGL